MVISFLFFLCCVNGVKKTCFGFFRPFDCFFFHFQCEDLDFFVLSLNPHMETNHEKKHRFLTARFMFFLILLNNTCSEPNREKKNAKDIRKTFNSPKRPPKVWIRRWNIISRKHECVVVSCRDCVRLWADVRCVCCCFSLFSHYFNSYSQIIHIVLMSYASVDKPPKYLILCVICFFFSFIFLVRSFAFVSVVVFFSFSLSLRLNLCEYHCYFKSIFDATSYVCVYHVFSLF